MDDVLVKRYGVEIGFVFFIYDFVLVIESVVVVLCR